MADGQKHQPAAVPSAVPTVEVDLFGERHTLKYGFRAYQELGLNPYDVASIKAYRDKQFSPLELSRQIWAGLLHQYFGRTATRKGQKPPTVDDVMDELDPINYIELWAQVQIALGVDDDPKAGGDPGGEAAAQESAPENPPQA